MRRRLRKTPVAIGVGLLLVLYIASRDLAWRLTLGGPAAIRITFSAAQAAAGAPSLCDSYADTPGVKRVACDAGAAVFIFTPNATAEQVATLSLNLERDTRVTSVLVTTSAHGDSGTVDP